MKHKLNIKIILSGFGLLLLTSCIISTSKTEESESKTKPQEEIAEVPQFTNTSMTPLIKGCEDDHNANCLRNTISGLILKEAKQRNLQLESDTLELGVRFNKDGSVSLMKNNTKNMALKALSEDVINAIDQVEPAYVESLNSYETISFSWFVIIQNNAIINRFKD